MNILIAVLALFFNPDAPTGTPSPNLCDLDGGWYCMECGPATEFEIQCSASALEGWLCCSPNGVCVAVATFDHCDGGIAGWCANYTTETLRNGVEVAVCEDPA